MRSLRKNQQGFSILESLLGLAMITLVGSFFISGTLSMRKVAKESGTKNSLYKQINDIIENVRPNVRMYQINFVQTEQEKNNMLALDALPMAWGNGMLVTKDKCKDCPGRYGFVIQAYPGMRGLYLVTVRVSHKDWAQDTSKQKINPKDFGFVDYEFVVNSQ